MSGTGRTVRPVCCLAVTALIVLAIEGTAAARRATLHVVRVDEFSALFDFLVGVDVERQRVLGIDVEPSEAVKVVLGQRLGLGARGSFVHPRFWAWRAEASVLFVEDILRGDLTGRWLEGNEARDKPGERYLIDPQFDVQFDFLRQHRTPVSVYGRRKTELLRREFRANTWVTTWATGGSASWNNPVFPVAVHYDYLRSEGDASQHVAGDDSHQLYMSGQQIAGPTTTSVEYRMTKYDNRYDPDQEYLFHFAQVANFLYLDEAQDYRIDSILWFQDRDAIDFDQLELRLRELFVGRLLPSLRLRAEYSVAWQRWQTKDFVQNTAFLELRHQLFRSLTTTGTARGTHDLGEDSERLEGVLSAAVAYRKELGPLVMRHSYQVAGSWARLETYGDDLSVFDEAVTLTGELPAPLGARDVDATSVVVLDSSRSKRYVRGLDYDLTETGGVTYLHRITGGNIADGAEVRVSYDYTTDHAPLTTVVDQIYLGLLETNSWEFVRVYAQYTLHDVQVDSSLTTRDALRYHDVGTGVDFRAFGARADVAFHYVTSQHYTAREVSASLTYAVPFAERFVPVFGIRELFLDIDQPQDRRNLLEVFSEARFPIWGAISGFWSVTYHWDVGSANDGHYALGRARVEWPFRKIRLWLEYVFAIERKEFEQYDRHTITLNLRRTF